MRRIRSTGNLPSSVTSRVAPEPHTVQLSEHVTAHAAALEQIRQDIADLRRTHVPQPSAVAAGARSALPPPAVRLLFDTSTAAGSSAVTIRDLRVSDEPLTVTVRLEQADPTTVAASHHPESPEGIPSQAKQIAMLEAVLPLGGPGRGPGEKHGYAFAAFGPLRLSPEVTALAEPGALPQVRPFTWLTSERLDRLWQTGEGLEAYRALVNNLHDLPDVDVHYKDVHGVTRTLNKRVRLPFAAPIPGHASTGALHPMRKGSSRNAAEGRGHIPMNPAAALALMCLAQADYDNFARIVGARPVDLIKTLLDPNRLTPGILFEAPVVSRVLAQAIPGAVGRGARTPELMALTRMYENFWSHHASEMKSPYRGLTHWLFGRRERGVDALVSHSEQFTREAAGIWTDMVPTNKPLDDILKHPRPRQEMELLCSLTACAIALHYNALFASLDAFEARAAEAKKRARVVAKCITGMCGKAVDTPINLGDPTETVSAVASAAAEPVVEEATETIAPVRGHKETASTREYLRTNRDQFENSHLRDGVFVPGERALKENERLQLISIAEGSPTSASPTILEGFTAKKAADLLEIRTGWSRLVQRHFKDYTDIV